MPQSDSELLVPVKRVVLTSIGFSKLESATNSPKHLFGKKRVWTKSFGNEFWASNSEQRFANGFLATLLKSHPLGDLENEESN